MWVNVYYDRFIGNWTIYNEDGFMGSWKFNEDDLVASIKGKIEKEYKFNRDHYNLTIVDPANKKEIRMYDDRPLSDYFYNDQNINVSPKPIWKIIFTDIRRLLRKRRGYQSAKESTSL